MVGSGKLSLLVQQEDERFRTLRGVFSDLAFFDADDEEPDADSKREQRRSLARELSRPFLVFMKSDGGIESISVDPALADGSLAFVRGFLATLQFVEPSGNDPSGRGWTALETDHLGICNARYERLGENQFKKKKGEYRYLDMLDKLAAPDGTPAKASPRISSEAVMELARGIVRKVELRESVVAPLEDVTVQTESHLTLQLVETQRVQATPFAPDGWKREPLYATHRASPERRLARLRRVLGNATFTDLWKDLVALKARSPDDKQLSDVIERLAAMFELHPESLRDLLRAVRSGAGGDETQLALAALAGAENPEAQAALGDLAGDSRLEPHVRRGAIMRLALGSAPTEDTLDSLRRLSDSGEDAGLRDTALLALGGAARHASDSTSTQDAARSAIRELQRGAADAKDVQRRTLLLSALGNTASPDVLETLRAYLADPDPQVRAAATNALRLIPGAEVDALLADIVLRDAEPLVRRSAAEALGRRSLDARLLGVLSTSLRSDNDVLVRLSVVDVLAAGARTLPGVRELLTWASVNDAEATVRDAARRALDPKAAKGARVGD